MLGADVAWYHVAEVVAVRQGSVLAAVVVLLMTVLSAWAMPAGEDGLPDEGRQIWITDFKGCHEATWTDWSGRGWYHVNIDQYPNPYLMWETVDGSPPLTRSGVFNHPERARAREYCVVDDHGVALAMTYDVSLARSFAGLFIFLNKDNAELNDVLSEPEQYALQVRMRGECDKVKIELKLPGIGWFYVYGELTQEWQDYSFPLADLEFLEYWPVERDLEFVVTLENHALEEPDWQGRVFLDHVAFAELEHDREAVAEREAETLLVMDDPIGDDYGPGTYVYPQHEVFDVEGAFDIRQVVILQDELDLIFRVRIAGDLLNPWQAPNGFSIQAIDLYLSTGPGGSRETIFDTSIPDNLVNNPEGTVNAVIAEEGAWQMAFRVQGWEGSLFVPMELEPEMSMLLGAAPEAKEIAFAPEPKPDARKYAKYMNVAHVRTEPETNTIVFSIPLHVVGEPTPDWTFVLYMMGIDWGNARVVRAEVGDWHLGGGEEDVSNPNIIDLLVPPGESQEEILDYRVRSPVVLPGIPLLEGGD